MPPQALPLFVVLNNIFISEKKTWNPEVTYVKKTLGEIVGSVTVPRNQSLSRFSRMTEHVVLVVQIFQSDKVCYPVQIVCTFERLHLIPPC